MSKKKLLWGAFGLIALAVLVIQFVPTTPPLIPALLPAAQREAHRLLNFEGIANFRDLGGYATTDGRHVKWGVLYRTGTLAHASNSDLEALQQLNLTTLIDFRSGAEKEMEPNRLPEPTGFTVVEIPTLDDGNEAMVGELMERIESGNFDGFDPNQTMLQANRQFASDFTPQFRQYIHTVVAANGAPIAFHCSAGKDRTGFAAAILLRLLGVPPAVVMRDYMASKQNVVEARQMDLWLLRLFKGNEAADKLTILMGVEQAWLEAAFTEIDEQWGSFDRYLSEGLQLTSTDIERLKRNLLERPNAR